MNVKYARLADGKAVYAPNALETEEGVVVNPSEETYLAHGWKRVVDEPPEPQEGCAVQESGWEEGEATLTRTYKQVTAPVPPPDPGGDGGEGGAGGGRNVDMSPVPAPAGKRVFSKLRLVAALKAAGLWVLTKTWIEENGLYDHYLAAQNLAEDNEWFLQGRSAIQPLARITDERVEEILAACVIE